MAYFARHALAPVEPALLANLRAQQDALRTSVSLVDSFEALVRVAGIDVGFEEEGRLTRAAVVVLRYPSLEVLRVHVARVETTFPYIPGFLSFREMPAIERAWASLEESVQLAFVDGSGIAHPRGMGIATHLGVVLDVPTIGVAKSRLVGTHGVVGADAGSEADLVFQGQRVGSVLRSKVRCNPLYVSPGHRVSVESSLALVKSTLRGYRLPEPTRLADRATATRYRDLDARLPSTSPDGAAAR